MASQDIFELQRELEALNHTAQVFAAMIINDASVRLEYQQAIRKMSQELLSQVHQRVLSAKDAAQIASGLRNMMVVSMRGRSSFIGRAYAEGKKSKLPLFEKELHKRSILRYGKRFEKLRKPKQRTQVFVDIVEAAGSDNSKVTRLAKVGGKVFKGIAYVTIALSIWKIMTAEDKLDATFREGIGAFASAVGSAAVAGIVCGPGAPACSVVAGIIGGVAFAIGTDFAYDYFKRSATAYTSTAEAEDDYSILPDGTVVMEIVVTPKNEPVP